MNLFDKRQTQFPVVNTYSKYSAAADTELLELKSEEVEFVRFDHEPLP